MLQEEIYLKHRFVYISKNNVSETEFCPQIRTSSMDWDQVSRFYFKMKTQYSLRNIVFMFQNKIYITTGPEMGSKMHPALQKF
jgi:hypothetical protein